MMGKGVYVKVQASKRATSVMCVCSFSQARCEKSRRDLCDDQPRQYEAMMALLLPQTVLKQDNYYLVSRPTF